MAATTTTIKIEPMISIVKPEKSVEPYVKIKTKAKQKRRSKLDKHIHNVKLILQYSNATTILRHRDKGYVCCYCMQEFPEPKDLKKHTLATHANEENHMGHIQIVGPAKFLVKLDITNLKCEICNDSIDSLEDLLTHLKEKHGKDIHTDLENHIFPFKFNTEEHTCCICRNDVVFSTFRGLHEHMHKHYRNYVCEVCDTGFVNVFGLKSHVRTHQNGTFVCRYCPIVFDNEYKRRNHESRSHRHPNSLNKCQYCNAGFREFYLKELHLAKVHGVKRTRKFKCTACDKTYASQMLLKVHIRRFHMMERNVKCSECDKGFFRAHDLKKHMLVHTGIKELQCEVCLKFYSKKSTLNQHMRIHNNDRRFKCEVCGEAFVQKSSYTWHMKAKHAEVYSNNS